MGWSKSGTLDNVGGSNRAAAVRLIRYGVRLQRLFGNLDSHRINDISVHAFKYRGNRRNISGFIKRFHCINKIVLRRHRSVFIELGNWINSNSRKFVGNGSAVIDIFCVIGNFACEKLACVVASDHIKYVAKRNISFLIPCFNSRKYGIMIIFVCSCREQGREIKFFAVFCRELHIGKSSIGIFHVFNRNSVLSGRHIKVVDSIEIHLLFTLFDLFAAIC